MLKRAGLLLAIVLSSVHVIAQTEVLVPIVNHQVFNLNSRSSIFFSGYHTSVIELNFPENTVRWYYRFYNVTKKDLLPKYAPKASLLDELERNMRDPENSKISTPIVPSAYQNKVSVYLLDDSSQVDVFNKQITFSKVQYQKQFSALNEASGWIEVCDPDFIFNKQHLGIMNRGTMTETYIVMDVVAVCKKRSIEFGWPEKGLKELEISFVDSRGKNLSPFIIQKVSNCLISSLQYKISYDEYVSLSKPEQEKVRRETFTQCYNSNFPVVEEDTLAMVSPYFVFGKWKTEREEILELNFSGTLNLIKKDQTSFQGIWYLAQDMLCLKFDGHPTRKYEAVMITPNRYVWRNNETGNFVKYNRLKGEE